MKKIESLSMSEDLASSPVEMKDMEDRSSSPDVLASDPDGENILTNDSLEEALNQQLADIEEEEETGVDELLASKDVPPNAGKTVEPSLASEPLTDSGPVEGDASLEEDGTTPPSVEPVEKDTSDDVEPAEDHPSDGSPDIADETKSSSGDSTPQSQVGLTAMDANVLDREDISPDKKEAPVKAESDVKAESEQNNEAPMEVDASETNDVSEQTPAKEAEVSQPSEVATVAPTEPKAPPKERLNLEEALTTLAKISQSAKGILEDDGSASKEKTGLKRALSIEEDKVSSIKRCKQVETYGEDEQIKLKKKIKKQIRLLSRNDLEDLFADKIVEMISSRSEIGQLRRKCDTYEEMNQKWKRQTQTIQKMCQDLNTVMRRFILDVLKEKEKLAPIKITRSVGLQYGTDRRRLTPLATANTNSPITAKRTSGPPTPQRPGEQNLVPSGVSVSRNIIAMLPTKPMPQVAVMPKTKPGVTVNISPTARQMPVMNGQVKSPTIRSIPQGSQINTVNNLQRKVIDVVNLDDEDDVQPAPQQPQAAQGSMRVIPTNQLQMTYNVIPNANTGTMMRQGINNRVTIARPQNQTLQPRNGLMNGGAMVLAANQPRPTQYVTNNTSRPIVIQTQQRSQMGIQTQRVGIRHIVPLTHPAPLPEVSPGLQNQDPHLKKVPPRPQLKISRLATGIVLSWNMSFLQNDHAIISMYQIYAYQETHAAPNQSLWKKVGDVKALPLPMACTLTQFMIGNRYHFAIRAQDVHNRVGQFSEAQSIALN